MPIAQRSAETIWEGGLGTGRGTIHPSSGAWDDMPVTWASRTERADGKTSPEELAAAAHSSCFAMALTAQLAERDVTPERLRISATVTLDDMAGAPTIVTSALKVRCLAPGLDSTTFKSAIDEASRTCPVSRLFTGAKISVDAELESS